MVMQLIPGGLWIPPTLLDDTAAPGFGSMGTIDAATDQNAFIFQVPKSGTLDGFEWRQLTNGNTPDNGLRFSFQDVDANGAPDNVEDEFAVVTAGFANGAWLVAANVMTNDGTAGGVKRTVTRGDWLACVIRCESFVAGDSIVMSTLPSSGVLGAEIDPMLQFVTNTVNSGTTWTKATAPGLAAMALKYDDGTYGTIGWPHHPAHVINTRTYNNATVAADERGLLFSLPFPARLSGITVRIDLDANVDVVVYNSLDIVIASASVVAGRRLSANGTNARVNFSAPVNLLVNAPYRVTVLPTTVTSISIYDFDTATQAIRESVDGGTPFMSTNRVNAGAWTDVVTNRPYIGLILDGFDDGVIPTSEHSAVF